MAVISITKGLSDKEIMESLFRGGEAAAAKTMIFAMVTKTEGIEEVQYIQIKKKKISQKLSSLQ